ncbi:hypothetical protein OBBRIDRAFT_236927 [Obba rivulosa]|uniref:Uncharacterized protein n=1 Tax=Obba rivulosa TaxID=1052685 RepID=A0A8E2DV19_9APHY|nr:hypothetical protein OBBRIDRAFT_236927 [Obba rivulosa]
MNTFSHSPRCCAGLSYLSLFPLGLLCCCTIWFEVGKFLPISTTFVRRATESSIVLDCTPRLRGSKLEMNEQVRHPGIMLQVRLSNVGHGLYLCAAEHMTNGLTFRSFQNAPRALRLRSSGHFETNDHKL